jgi:quercetin dioxygenase-like cupin family protein
LLNIAALFVLAQCLDAIKPLFCIYELAIFEEFYRSLLRRWKNRKRHRKNIMSSTTPYTQLNNINEAVQEIPLDSIVSRTVYRDDSLKAIVFGFATGQELSEHTASVPAIVQILEGECQVTLGDDVIEAQAGFWTRMPAKLPHSILARTPVKMLLLMLSDGKEAG